MKIAVISIFTILFVLVILSLVFFLRKSRNKLTDNNIDFEIPFVIDMYREKVYFDKDYSMVLKNKFNNFFELSRTIRSFLSVFSIPLNSELIEFITLKNKLININEMLPTEYETFFNFEDDKNSYYSRIVFYDYDRVNKRISGSVYINNTKRKEDSRDWLWTNITLNETNNALVSYSRFITNRRNKRKLPYCIYMFDISPYIDRSNYSETIYYINKIKNTFELKGFIFSNLSDSQFFIMNKKRYSKKIENKLRRYISSSISREMPFASSKNNYFLSVSSVSNFSVKIEIKGILSFTRFNLNLRWLLDNKKTIISDDRNKKQKRSLYEKYMSYDLNIEEESILFLNENYDVKSLNLFKKDKSKKVGKVIKINHLDNISSYGFKFNSNKIYSSFYKSIVNKYHSDTDKFLFEISYLEIVEFITHFDNPNFDDLISGLDNSKNLAFLVTDINFINFDEEVIKKFNEICEKQNIKIGVKIYDYEILSHYLSKSSYFKYVFISEEILLQEKKLKTVESGKNFTNLISNISSEKTIIFNFFYEPKIKLDNEVLFCDK